ncbi:MAG: right-handed parallel beta-helix repeat-containing protein [Planctomycetota bacterium]|jgi:hypothetical protein
MGYTHKTLTIVAMGFFAVLGTPGVDAGTIYVDDSATGANNGMSWDDAFIELQSALAVATSGDEIWVAGGTYTPDYDVNTGMHTGDRIATFQLLNGVALYGGLAGNEDPATFNLDDRDFEANETILSGDLNGDDAEVSDPTDLLTEPTRAENSYHVVTGSGTDETAIVDGFTITAGNADGSLPHDRGGGMYNYNGSPTISNCTFSGNSAQYVGGGMYNKLSSPTLTNCGFSGNSAVGGGGMFSFYSNPTLTNCTISGNSARKTGGGMTNSYSSPTLTDCTISGNSADWSGGGMYNYVGNPTLTNCTISGNASNSYGGGMYNQVSNPTLTNCTVSGNSAVAGGGMYNWNYSSPKLTNCTISGNSAWKSGGGMSSSRSNPALTNCTISGNLANSYGGGLYNSRSSLTMTNSILWGNTAPKKPQMYNYRSSFVITYSNIQGSWSGEGNIDEDPLFVRNPDDGGDGWGDDPATPDVDEGANDDYGDLHLQSDSPCIDTGNNNSIPPDITTDLDGNPRIVNDIVDMGAYEFQMVVEVLNLDIKPGSCPNPLNTNTRGKGRLPMAILGTEDFDVSDIDPNSISIVGTVLPVRTPVIEDVGTPFEGEECECHDLYGDGYTDLVIHFSRWEIILALGLDGIETGTVVPITVEGELLDGTPFEATDCVTLVPRED